VSCGFEGWLAVERGVLGNRCGRCVGGSRGWCRSGGRGLGRRRGWRGHNYRHINGLALFWLGLFGGGVLGLGFVGLGFVGLGLFGSRRCRLERCGFGRHVVIGERL
jgi:hypothetical protein